MKKLVKSCSSTATVATATLLMSSCATIVSGGAPSITINGNVPEPVMITTEEQGDQGTVPMIIFRPDNLAD